MKLTSFKFYPVWRPFPSNGVWWIISGHSGAIPETSRHKHTQGMKAEDLLLDIFRSVSFLMLLAKFKIFYTCVISLYSWYQLNGHMYSLQRNIVAETKNKKYGHYDMTQRIKNSSNDVHTSSAYGCGFNAIIRPSYEQNWSRIADRPSVLFNQIRLIILDLMTDDINFHF